MWIFNKKKEQNEDIKVEVDLFDGNKAIASNIGHDLTKVDIQGSNYSMLKIFDGHVLMTKAEVAIFGGKTYPLLMDILKFVNDNLDNIYNEMHKVESKQLVINNHLVTFDDLWPGDDITNMCNIKFNTKYGNKCIFVHLSEYNLFKLEENKMQENENHCIADDDEYAFTHDFSWALRKLKAGCRIHRSGWNGKGMFAVLQKGYPEGIPCNKQTAEAWGLNEGDLFRCEPYMQLKMVNGSHSMWVPSVNDCLSTDWAIAK